MKKSWLSILAALTLGLTSPLFAQSPAPDAAGYFRFLAPGDLKTLLEKGELVPAESSGSLPWGHLAPFAGVLGSEFSVASPSFTQEGIYLFPRPAGDALVKVYNALNAVASMKGLQYYSLSQKAMETLFLESYRVDSVEKSTRLPDPQVTVIPEVQRTLVFQKDNRLGEGYSDLVYRLQPFGLSLAITNRTELKYGFLPLVAPGQLQMLFVVVPLADKIAVYSALEVKTASLFGLEHSKDENFRNRLRALAGWLGQRIASVPGAGID